MNALRRCFVAFTLGLIFATGSALAVQTVVIDAGHGGHDRGGGPGQRIPESPYTLDISRRLRAALQTAGFRTVMTRDGDYFVSLGGRCAIANRERDALMVSVHLNSGQREGADGVETYHYGTRSASLAASVHAQVVAAAGTEDRRVRQRGFYVLRNTRIPAIIIECGFLTNRKEGARISGSAGHRQKLAEAIARGVARFR